MRKLLAVFLVILCLVLPGMAKNIFVSQSYGLDTYSGLYPSAPKLTLAGALAVAGVLDIIYFLDYSEDLADGSTPYDIGAKSMIGLGYTQFDAKNLTSGETIVFRVNIGSAYAYNMTIQNITFKNSDTTPEFVGAFFTDTGTFSTSYPYKISILNNIFSNCGSITGSADRCFYFANAGPCWEFRFNYCYDSFSILRENSACYALYGRSKFHNNVFEGSVATRYSGVNIDNSFYGADVMDNAFIRMAQGIAAHNSVVGDSVRNHENNNIFYLVTTPLYLNKSSSALDATDKNGINPLITNGQTSNNSPIFNPDSATTWASSGTYSKRRGITPEKIGVVVQ
jgi:hypothetical protein